MVLNIHNSDRSLSLERGWGSVVALPPSTGMHIMWASEEGGATVSIKKCVLGTIGLLIRKVASAICT